MPRCASSQYDSGRASDWLTDEAQYLIESRSDYSNDGDWQCRVTNHKARPESYCDDAHLDPPT